MIRFGCRAAAVSTILIVSFAALAQTKAHVKTEVRNFNIPPIVVAKNKSGLFASKLVRAEPWTVGFFGSSTREVQAVHVIYGYENPTRRLLSFSSDSPSTMLTDIPLLGLGQSEQLIGIDFRPLTGELFGIATEGTANRVIKIDLGTGMVSTVGSGFAAGLSQNIRYGMDFDPISDVIRLIGSNGINLRLSPMTGQVTAVDTNIRFLESNPNVAHVAYSPVPGQPPSATLYGIDYQLRALFRIGGIGGEPSPNQGQATLIGFLGVVIEDGFGGMDVPASVSSNIAYAVLSRTVNGEILRSLLYTVDLTTGAATQVGFVGFNGFRLLDGIAIAPTLTSAPVSISGRVLSTDGLGVSNALVSIEACASEFTRVLTDPSGYFNFPTVAAGSTCIISVKSRRFVYSPRPLTVYDGISDLELFPDSERSHKTARRPRR
jgi:hypothetical protein